MESTATAIVPARSPISRTVISVIPLITSTTARCAVPRIAASHDHRVIKNRIPITISRIAVPTIACAMDMGSSPAAHGCRYPANASGCLRMSRPIHTNVIPSPTRKTRRDAFLIVIVYVLSEHIKTALIQRAV